MNRYKKSAKNILFCFIALFFISCNSSHEEELKELKEPYQMRAKEFWVPWHSGVMIYFVNRTTHTCYSRIGHGPGFWNLLSSCDSLKNIPDIKHFLNPLEEKYEH